MFNRIISFFIISLYFASVMAQEFVPESDTDFRSAIRKMMVEHEGVGLSVVVVKHNEIIFYDAFGYNPDYSNLENRQPIEKNNVYYIASISKTFVGTAVMQLAEQGKLSLDDDVNDYLDFNLRNPFYPDIPITVKMLLSHTSSMSKNNIALNDYDFNLLNPERNKKYKDCFNDYRPGTKYEYTNFGYIILGAIIEKASNIRFDTYIKENILQPLGLKGSFNMADIQLNRCVNTYQYTKGKFMKRSDIYSYDERMNNYVLGFSTPALHPADGMKITAWDLAKYMIMHMNKGVGLNGNRIISEKSETLLRDNNIHNLYSTNNYVPGVQLIGMNGGAKGMHTEMFFSPDKQYGFVILCNGCNSTGAADGGLNKQVMQELYKAFIAE